MSGETGEKRRFTVETLDDAIEMLNALEEFFSKYENARKRFIKLVQKYGGSPRFTYTYGRRPSGIESYLEDLMRQELEKALRATLGRRISEEEVDKIISEVREELGRESSQERTLEGQEPQSHGS